MPPSDKVVHRKSLPVSPFSWPAIPWNCNSLYASMVQANAGKAGARVSRDALLVLNGVHIEQPAWAGLEASQRGMIAACGVDVTKTGRGGALVSALRCTTSNFGAVMSAAVRYSLLPPAS